MGCMLYQGAGQQNRIAYAAYQYHAAGAEPGARCVDGGLGDGNTGVHFDVAVRGQTGTVAGIEQRAVLEGGDCGDYGVQGMSAAAQESGTGGDRSEQSAPAARAVIGGSAPTGAAVNNQDRKLVATGHRGSEWTAGP